MVFVRVAGNPEPEGAEAFWFEGRGGAKIRAMTAPALGGVARGSVIVCGGRTEFIEKYFEVICELQARGFAVFSLDWRGQGMSDRPLGNPLKGHIDSFDDAVSDLAQGLKQAGDKLPRPHLLLAHSMGGAIALRALQTRRVEVEGALFTSPMWAIARLNKGGRDFARFFTAIGWGGLFAPGQATKWRKENFRSNPVTHDRERQARAQALVLQDSRLALAGVTLGWLAAASEAMEGFRQSGALAHLRCPVVILSAGDDSLVDNESHDAIAKALPNARRVIMNGAKHEILMEKNEIREGFWRAFDNLAATAAPARVAAT
jgi:lysophospholipase